MSIFIGHHTKIKKKKIKIIEECLGFLARESHSIMGSLVVCRAHIAANIIRMINSRRMRRPGNVTGKEDVRNAYRFLVGNIVGKEQPMGSVNVFKLFLKKEQNDKIVVWGNGCIDPYFLDLGINSR
jgi:hypothetical protein